MKVNLRLDLFPLLCVAALPQSPNTSNHPEENNGLKQEERVESKTQTKKTNHFGINRVDREKRSGKFLVDGAWLTMATRSTAVRCMQAKMR